LFLLVYQLATFNVCTLQSILNTAVRLVTGSSRRDHVISLLQDRHWLPVKQRVEYTLCTIVMFIVVCTATHHPTWSTSSRRLLLQVPELV